MSNKFHDLRLNKVLQFVAVSVLAVLFSELGMRFLVSLEPVAVDPILGLRAKPGPGTDARGYSNAVALDRADIVALGDSMTFGGNATRDEAWPQVLGELASTTIYNMGMSGYGPVQDAAILEDALALKPDTVILGFYVGNDVIESYTMAYENEYWRALRSPDFSTDASTATPDYRIVLSMGIEEGSTKYYLHKAALALREHSLAYARFADVTRTFRERIGLAQTGEDNEKAIAKMAREHPDVVFDVVDRGIETLLLPAEQLKNMDLTEAKTREGWRITQQLMEEMSAKSSEAGARLVVLILPTKEEVYLQHWKIKGTPIPTALSSYDAVSVHLRKELQFFCEKARIQCVDPLFDLAKSMESNRRLFSASKESHPLPGGYKIIAENLRSFFVQ